MKYFTADFCLRGSYGFQVCTEDTISELIETLKKRGYWCNDVEVQELNKFAQSNDKKYYYGMNLRVRKGELEMTEYTSF